MSRLKIGITADYQDGYGYEIILKAFEDPTLAELCTPIVFGNKEDALQQRRNKEIQTNFLTIKDIDDAAEDRLNIMECHTRQQSEADAAESPDDKTMNCLHAASQNIGQLDALVVCLDKAKFPCPTDRTEILLSEHIRIIVAEAKDMEAVDAARIILERNFGCTATRMAVISTTGKDLHELTEEATGKGIWVYGAYNIQEFVEDNTYRHFDGGIVADTQTAEEILHGTNSGWTVRAMLAGDDKVITSPVPTPYNDIEADVDAMRQAIYAAIDMRRCRTAYDEARACPLKKLFHDRREDRRNNVE